MANGYGKQKDPVDDQYYQQAPRADALVGGFLGDSSLYQMRAATMESLLSMGGQYGTGIESKLGSDRTRARPAHAGDSALPHPAAGARIRLQGRGTEERKRE